MTEVHKTIHDGRGIKLQVEDDEGRVFWVEADQRDDYRFKITRVCYPEDNEWGHHVFQASIEVRDEVVSWFNRGGMYTMESGAITTEAIQQGYEEVEPEAV